MADDMKNLARLSETLVASKSFRKAFNADPFAAARAVGLDTVNARDLGTLDALASLNDDELEVLKSIRTKMINANPDLARVSDVIGGVIF